jgi:hypothetical protein
MDVDQELLTQAALARRWKVSPRTLERWRWLGRGPQYIKVVGQVRYRCADVEAYEAAQLRATATATTAKQATPLRLVRA